MTEKHFKLNALNLYNQDNAIGMTLLPDQSADCILTDPPYLYLKNQKLDRVFDEKLFFSECKRILRPEGFIVLFGRGTSFYRWNVILDKLGFIFKEELIWDKKQTTSPVLPVNRVHETISVFTKGIGKINSVKIPYEVSREFNISAIYDDVNRIKTAFNNSSHFEDILSYLQNLKRTDYLENNRASKHGVTFGSKRLGKRVVNAVQFIAEGMKEKTIISINRNHYKSIHPTEKPVMLIERLLKLTTKEGSIVIDPFSGSCSTGIACMNLGLKFIGFEIDEEYYLKSVDRLKKYEYQGKLFS